MHCYLPSVLHKVCAIPDTRSFLMCVWTVAECPPQVQAPKLGSIINTAACSDLSLANPMGMMIHKMPTLFTNSSLLTVKLAES